ncbi:MORN motif [Phytophthora cactorum]|nr:MORN motif [Phytophthora cactorum]
MNSSIHFLDLVASTWAAITIASENPESSIVPRVLTARCCATVLALQLPIDEETGIIRRIKDGELGEKPCNPQEAIVIFGGFSEYEPALSSSSMIILEPQLARIREVQVPTSGIMSYMGHATAIRPDQRGFFLFGGIPIPDHEQPQPFLDSTTALDFWKTPTDFPSEAEEQAQRQADENPIKKKTLSNGDVYVGEMNADQTQRHGKGKCSYANGDEYDGDWRDDQRCGQGVMRYASSHDMYAGQWKNDQRHGYGIYDFHLPESFSGAQQRQPKKYEGQWMNDRKHGTGTLTFSNGTNSWAHGSMMLSILASEVASKGTTTAGMAFADMKVKYVMGFLTVKVYTGDWVTGTRSGHGVATLRDGSVYRGEWRNGRRNGFGVFDDARTERIMTANGWYANGCEYKGDWLNDVRHGTGCYTLLDGSCYDGAWLHDKFCGDGSFMLNIEDNDIIAQNNEVAE